MAVHGRTIGPAVSNPVENVPVELDHISQTAFHCRTSKQANPLKYKSLISFNNLQINIGGHFKTYFSAT